MPTSRTKSIILILLISLMSSCMCLGYLPLLECRSSYADERYSSPSYYYTNYPIRANKKTREGIKYDDSGLNLNMDQINRMDTATDELEKCLGIKVGRCGFSIKIVNDYRYAPDGRQEFPCRANKRGWCYGIIQYPGNIIIPPDFDEHILKHEEYHLFTHSDHPKGQDFSEEEKRCL